MEINQSQQKSLIYTRRRTQNNQPKSTKIIHFDKAEPLWKSPKINDFGKGGHFVEINRNLWKFIESQWKYMKIQRKCNENTIWRFRRNSKKLQRGTLTQINGNLWKFNKIQWKYMKIQRKCNKAATWRLHRN